MKIPYIWITKKGQSTPNCMWVFIDALGVRVVTDTDPNMVELLPDINKDLCLVAPLKLELIAKNIKLTHGTE